MKSSKRKVLIVEDEFVLYQQLTEFFEDKGYDIIGHQNGAAVDNYDDAIKLLQNQEPDIAILDIAIKGKKDGLEVAAFIKEHFNTLIIMLTAHPNHGNVERATQIAVDDFFLKIDKPINKEQLWVSISIRLPKLDTLRIRKSQGDFFKVREIDTKHLVSKNKTSAPGSDYDPLDLETFIRWEDITYITSYNSKTAGEGNNNILMHTSRPNKAYVNRKTMSEIYQMLPEYFARFNQSAIVNLNYIDAKRKGNLYFIGEETFALSDSYRSSATDRIRLVLGSTF